VERLLAENIYDYLPWIFKYSTGGKVIKLQVCSPTVYVSLHEISCIKRLPISESLQLFLSRFALYLLSAIYYYTSPKKSCIFFYHYHLSNNFIYIPLHYLYFGKINFVFNTIVKRIPIVSSLTFHTGKSAVDFVFIEHYYR
jgi:hypothetical protein